MALTKFQKFAVSTLMVGLPYSTLLLPMGIISFYENRKEHYMQNIEDAHYHSWMENNTQRASHEANRQALFLGIGWGFVNVGAAYYFNSLIGSRSNNQKRNNKTQGDYNPLEIRIKEEENSNNPSD